MRIFLFVGTIDALMSIIGYMYYRHYLPFGRTLTFGLIYLLMALGTAVSVILPQGTPHFLLKLTAWIEGLWIAFATTHFCWPSFIFSACLSVSWAVGNCLQPKSVSSALPLSAASLPGQLARLSPYSTHRSAGNGKAAAECSL